MNAKKSKTTDLELSEQLRLAISAEFIQAHPDLSIVTGNDLNHLKKILRGESKPDFPVDLKRAIMLLARSETSTEAAEILAEILSNKDETEANRSVSALGLSKMPVEIAEKNLLKNLLGDNPFIRAEILKSLARIGSNVALEQLNKLRFPGDLNSQQQLSLAKLLINVRSNPDEISLSNVRETLGISFTDQKVKTVTGKALKDLISQLGDRNFNVSLNKSVGFGLECGGLTHYLLLNAELKQGDFIDSLRRKALIAGIVVAGTEDLSHVTPRYIVLSFPSEIGLEVIVTRVNGEAIYNGEISRSDTSLRGFLRDIGIERTPTQIEVVISNNEIEINNKLWQGTPKQKKPGRLLIS